MRLFTAAVAAVFLLVSAAHASQMDLKPTDLEKFSCSGETVNLGMSLALKVDKHQDQFLETLHIYDGDRHSYMGPPDADGWRRFEHPFLDTSQERDENGRRFAAKPFRLWKLVGRVGPDCEFADLAFERDWVSEITGNVIDKCFRYYAWMAGNRSEADIKLAIRLLTESQTGPDSWMVRKIIEVRDNVKNDYGSSDVSGGMLRFAYGRHVIQCQDDIEQGKLAFQIPD